MKEVKDLKKSPIIATHYPLSKRSDPRLPWVVAQERPAQQLQQGANSSTEFEYLRIVEFVKQRLEPGTSYFYRDFRYDKEEHLAAMYSFLCPSFYICLDCSFDYEYVVDYSFFNCPFEMEIREMLKPFPMDRRATERKFEQSFTAFYNGVMILQDSKYIFTL